MRTTVPGLLLLACVLTACGQESEAAPTSDRVDFDRMLEVSQDEDATAAEVVEAGQPVNAAASGGTRLVVYSVHNDDDEGRSAAAWRLYDADGGTLAEGHAAVVNEGHATVGVVGLADGYLLVDDDGGDVRRVTTDGTVSDVRRVPARSPAPGDLRLGFWSTHLYRPSDDTVARSSPKPTGTWQGWAASPDGTSWMQGEPDGTATPFRRSRDGSTWEDVRTFDPGPGRIVASNGLAAVGSRVVAPVVTVSEGSEDSRLDGVIVRDSVAPAQGRWTYHRTPSISGSHWWDIRLLPAGERTVAVADFSQPPYLVDLETGDVRRVTPPTDDEDWRIRVDGPELVAFHPEHAAARVSDDLGATWTRLPH